MLRQGEEKENVGFQEAMGFESGLVYRIRSNYGPCSNYGTPLFFASECISLFGHTYIVKILVHSKSP